MHPTRALPVPLVLAAALAVLGAAASARAQFENTQVSGLGAPPFLLTKQNGWVWQDLSPTIPQVTYNVYRKRPGENFRWLATNLATNQYAGDPASPVAECWWYVVNADDTWGENTTGNGFPIEDPPPCSGPAPVSGRPPLKLQTIATGFSSPVFLASAPGDRSRLFVVEQAGRIRLLKRGVLQPTAFLDIRTTRVLSGGERGLLSMAFHPQYAQNGRFFVYYTARSPTGQVTVSEFHVSPSNLDQADGTPERIVFTTPHADFSNHNGGQLQFGPDGYLYFGIGDGGSGGDPNRNGQNTSLTGCAATGPCPLLGKIHRIDVDGMQPYAIPPSNPYAASATSRPEIWAYGIRNPWRFSFNRGNGDLYLADVGQGAWEEIDVEPAGGPGGNNYGWNVVEGLNHCYSPATGCNLTGKVPPVLDYSHSQGNAVVGGYVYRGCRVPGYDGTYFYADNGSSWVRSFVYSSGVATNQLDWTSAFSTAVPPLSSPSGFGQDQQGEIYVLGYTAGAIFRIVHN